MQKGRERIDAVTGFLQSHDIWFDLVTTQEPAFSCHEVASARGIGVSQVLKCIVGEDGSSSLHVMMVPGDARIKLRRVSRVADVPDISLVSPDRLLGFGLVIGAISPIQFCGLEGVRFYMDNTVLAHSMVDMSSGDPRTGILLDPDDLAGALNAERCDIINARSRLRRD